MNLLLLDKETVAPFIPVRSGNGLSLFYLIRNPEVRVYAHRSELSKFRRVFPFKRIRLLDPEKIKNLRDTFTIYRGNNTKGFREIIAA